MTKHCRRILLVLLVLFAASTCFSADKLFLIVVNSILKPNITAALNTYMNDLIQDGYKPEIKSWTLAGSTPEELRDYLKTRVKDGLYGVIMVGDLPYTEYYFSFGTPIQGPCDYFFMDLTSTFAHTAPPAITDHDGIYDSPGQYDTPSVNVFGKMPATIMVGRLRASGFSLFPGKTETDLINNYFVKNHAYRTCTSVLSNRALNGSACINDGNGAIQASPITQVMQYAYNDYIQCTTADKTTDILTHARLMSLMQEPRDFIFVNAHGCATYCLTDDATVFANTDFKDFTFQNWFYYLYSCDLGNWAYNDNHGNASIYPLNSGIGTIAYAATTYSGQDSGQQVLFGQLARNKCLGEAVLQAINYGWNGSFEWPHVTIMGDPTLRLYMISAPKNLSCAKEQGKNTLAWTPNTETNLKGYNIYRSTGTDYTKIAGPVTENTYIDYSIPSSTPYYKIRAVTSTQILKPLASPPPPTNSESQFSNMAAGGTADSLDYVKVYPNPVSISSSVDGKIKIIGFSTDCTLTIYTSEGAKVRTLKSTSPGLVEWDFKNGDGQVVSRGMYTYRLETPSGASKTGKLGVLK
jgi:hypothetical protein